VAARSSNPVGCTPATLVATDDVVVVVVNATDVVVVVEFDVVVSVANVVVVTAAASETLDVESVVHAAHTHNATAATTLRMTLTVPPDRGRDQASST
jgi:hypothetical protein